MSVVWLPSWCPGAPREGASHYNTVIFADGQWLGTVKAPPGLRNQGAFHGLTLGVQRDETEVESVVVHEMAGE